MGDDDVTRKKTAKQLIDNALKEVASANGWDNVSEATRELLGYFNIGNESNTPTTSSSSSSTTSSEPFRNQDGSVTSGSRNPKTNTS